jgi:hypothetical protein
MIMTTLMGLGGKINHGMALFERLWIEMDFWAYPWNEGSRYILQPVLYCTMEIYNKFFYYSLIILLNEIYMYISSLSRGGLECIVKCINIDIGTVQYNTYRAQINTSCASAQRC